jgi:three-Cys-motif partner protein
MSFFNKTKSQSIIKSEIVSNYFEAWLNIMNNRNSISKLAYIDLFSGPGEYEDGFKSTPIKIIKYVLEKKNITKDIIFLFNDKLKRHTKNLADTISKIDRIQDIPKKSIMITNQIIDDEFFKKFEDIKMIPSFVFIDPFGYKGLTIDLINSFLKNWGTDCLFFGSVAKNQ